MRQHSAITRSPEDDAAQAPGARSDSPWPLGTTALHLIGVMLIERLNDISLGNGRMCPATRGKNKEERTTTKNLSSTSPASVLIMAHASD